MAETDSRRAERVARRYWSGGILSGVEGQLKSHRTEPQVWNASRDRSNVGNRHDAGSKVVLLVYGLSWLPRGMERFARKYTTKVPMTLRLRRSLYVDVHPAHQPAVPPFLAGFCHVRLREDSGLLVEDAAALVDEVHLFVLSLSAVSYYPPLEIGLAGNGRLRFENPQCARRYYSGCPRASRCHRAWGPQDSCPTSSSLLSWWVG